MNTTDSIRLYAIPTPNSQRVAIALEELGFNYDVHIVDRGRNEQNAPEFLALNPAAMMPVIVDGDTTIAQSGAILIYLAEKMGRLLPENGPARFKTLQWLMHVLTDIQSLSGVLYLARNKVEEPHAETLEVLEARLMTFIAHCDAALAQSDWLAGEFSIADIALYPVVAFRRTLIDQHKLHHIARWADRLKERDAVRRGMELGTPSVA